MIFLNYVADFLQLYLFQKVLFWWHDLSQLCGGFSTTTYFSKGSIFVTRSFCSYIFLRMFYFGDMIFLNYVTDFLQLHLFQKVQFLWKYLSQSCGGFLQLHLPQNVLFWWQASYPPFWELIKLSTTLGIWCALSTILGINQVIHHFRNLERVIHHFGNLSKGYPPV